MSNKRSAFTMLELVFVIVIIGMLSSIAIPRLSAARDDASIARELESVAVRLQTIAANYTARGEYNLDDTAYLTSKCFTFKETTADDKSIKISVIRNSDITIYCDKANKRAIINNLVGVYVLTIYGSSINYN